MNQIIERNPTVQIQNLQTCFVSGQCTEQVVAATISNIVV